MKLKNVLVVYAYECDTVELVKATLKKHEISFKAVKRDFLNRSLFPIDLVISVAGDGTFLKTSHYIKDATPILGVNCNPRVNEGFFTRAMRDDFTKKFNRILKDDFHFLKLTRLEAVLNGTKLAEFALNEVFIGDVKPYQVSHYKIAFEGKEETQISSGVLVATAAGSHAWAKSTGGFYLPLESNKFQFVVREPYQGRLSGKYALIKGMLYPNQQITLVSRMKDGIIVIDSNSAEYPFKEKDVLTVRTTKRVLNSVNFSN